MGTPVLLTTMAPIVTGVGQCVVNALSASWGGLDPAFRACLLLPTAQIPWDGCSCAGQFAQAIPSRGASAKFPTYDSGTNWHACGPPLDVATVVTSLSRCVPTMDDQGNPPTCDASFAAALQVEADRETIRQALACCLNALAAPRAAGLLQVTAWNVGPSVLVGELSGCVAIETPYSIAIGSCLCGS